jgi:hypothetical protein
MLRRTRVWQTLAVLFVLLNVGAFVYAARMREVPHAALHVALAMVGVYLIRRLGWRRAPEAGSTTAVASGEFRDRLTRLEQSIDAAALEVERIGEGQRFMTRLFSEQDGAKDRPAVDAVHGEEPYGSSPLGP